MVLSLRTKLAASIVVVMLAMGVVSTIVGTRLFGDSLVRQIQRNVEHDLNTAELVYETHLGQIDTYVQLVAGETRVALALRTGDIQDLRDFLTERREAWGLDLLTATDAHGVVVARSRADAETREDVSSDQIVSRALSTRRPVAGTVLVGLDELEAESVELAEQARMPILETPRARQSDGTVLENGMLLKAAAPVLAGGEIVGTIYGGVLLNRRRDIVDRVKETAYKGETWKGKDIGASTIFQDDVRIATNVLTAEGNLAFGTRVSEEVYERVIGKGERWIARAFVVDEWFITAYEPIRDLDDNVIGVLSVGVVSGRSDAMRSRTVWTFAIVSVAGMVLALIFASVLSGGIVRPIRDLATASREIAEGKIDTRVPVKSGTGSDELTELARTFNSMAQSIAERDAQLQENARKMTESKKLATLGQLAAGIAHEINNPLGGIVMYSHMLREDLKDAQNRENVEKIGREADRCKKIVKGLLDFARQTKPERTESNINHVLKEVIALVVHQAMFRNIEIENDHNPSIPLVDIDVTQMEEVFMNIILNAAQALDGRGKITTVTRLTPDNNYIEIVISDTGPGIPQEHVDKIFEPFYTTKEIGRGTGLGLSIAYGIVERHHGSIWVESEEGKGTSFFIRLPIPEAAPEM
jgi:two-component system NtrC family sensor kinase